MHAYTGNSLIGDASTLDGRMDAMSRPMHCGFPFSAGGLAACTPGHACLVGRHVLRHPSTSCAGERMHSGLPFVPGNACLEPALVLACCSREYMHLHVLSRGTMFQGKGIAQHASISNTVLRASMRSCVVRCYAMSAV